MAVWYLDNDAEITDAVARLRKATDEHVVFVIPTGSRIATGRINFKLLAREAEARQLRLAIASRDEQVRAMAASAGVLGLASVEEAKAALERGDVPAAAQEAPEPSAVDEATPALAAGSARIATRRRVAATSIGVLALVLAGGYAAVQTLPTAQITLRPRTSPLGPIEVAVVAAAGISEPDVEAGHVPAVEVAIPLAAEGTFAASGTQSVETHARGEVVFSSPQQAAPQLIESGTILRTPTGAEFRTSQGVILPVPDDGPGPSEVAAPVEALVSGADGNVAAGSISVVVSPIGNAISVTNPEPTSGGRSEQVSVVSAADYDAAALDLGRRLADALAAHVADPANAPDGLTTFGDTASLGQVTLTPPADELVGAAGAEFALRGTAAAHVLGVDEGLVDHVIRERLEAAAPGGTDLVEGSLDLGHGEGAVDGERIRFEGHATGSVAPRVDDDAVRAEVAGLPVSEARAILEAIGTTTVSVWPDFLGQLPSDQGRIALDLLEPSTTE